MLSTAIAILLALGFAATVLTGLATIAHFGVQRIMSKHRTPESTTSTNPLWSAFTDSLTARALAIAALTLAMLVPLSAVRDVVRERDGLHRSALADIAGIWGGSQTLRGPVLVVPYVDRCVVEETATDEDGGEQKKTRVEYRHREAVVLPDQLTIDVDLREQFRHRGIYEALVYTATVGLRGEFSRPDLTLLSDSLERIDWERAYVAVALSDTRAIHQVSTLAWDGTPQTLAPGTRLGERLGSGFHAPLQLDAERQSYRFTLDLSFHGSQGLRFAPFGETTEVAMTSTWPHPSFQGSALPSHYETGPDGFTATWSIPHLARNYPQLFRAGANDLDLAEFLAGVDLFEPVFLYSKVTRAVKYGLLFIGLTFLTLFGFELASPVRFHYLQYGLIGIALSLFYLTLLSLAEHLTFGAAYLIASALNLGMIVAYAGAVTRSASRTAVVGLTLAALYALLFCLLRLESYALLLGTGLLSVVIAALMYLTRNLRADLDPGRAIPAQGSS